MRWYLLVLILLLLDEVHSKAMVFYNKDVRQSVKRGAISFTAAQRQFQQDMLKAHNSYRALHCAPSLTFNDTINQSAQLYAQHLASTNTFNHSNTKDLGENLYMTSSSYAIKTVNGTAATESWYIEVKNYNFTAAQFSLTAGHFTQVVWKSTKTFGCGFAVSANDHYAYVVAQYSVPGNCQGAFKANVLPKQQRC